MLNKEEANSSQKEKKIMADDKSGGAGAGDLSFGKAEDLAGFIATVKGLKPEEQSVKALQGLETLAAAWSGQKGPFTPAAAPSFPVPVVATPGEQGAEKLEITWKEAPSLDEAKTAITGAITGFHSKALTLEKTVGELTGKVTALGTEIQGMKAHAASEQIARIKLHSGLSDADMKAYDGLSHETLKTIADHFEKVKGHAAGGEGGEKKTPLDPPAGGKGGKGGKRSREDLDALNDQMDAQLGIKAKERKSR